MPKPLNQDHADKARKAIAACGFEADQDIRNFPQRICSSTLVIFATAKASTSSIFSRKHSTPGPLNASIP